MKRSKVKNNKISTSSYKITFRNKIYHRNGCDAREAMASFARRKCFGNPIIFSYKTLLIDADTDGEKWGFFLTFEDEIVIVTVELEKPPKRS